MARLDPQSCIERARSWPTRHPGTALILGSILLVYILELSVAWHDGNVARVLLEGLPTPSLESLVKFSLDQALPYWLLTLISSTLAHGSWDHLIVNAAIIGLFGPAVERWLDSPAHVFTFFAIGAASSLAQAGVTGGSMWGASGPAIAYGTYWPIAGYNGSLFPEPETSEAQWVAWGLRLLVFLFFLLLALPGPGAVNPGTSHVAHLVGLISGGGLAAVAWWRGRRGSPS